MKTISATGIENAPVPEAIPETSNSATGIENAPVLEAIPETSNRSAAANETSRPHDPYTIFTKLQKRWIVLLVAFAGMFSPLSSFIYYPAITSVAKDLSTTVELINLTITSYMIVSGITPAIVGDLADTVGRRPVYIFTFAVYCAANVGLAVQRSYPALVVLRMVQSFGGSGTIAIAYAVVADISSPAERGSYVGAVLCG
jgi:Na+/melibiose symporter-like transporter